MPIRMTAKRVIVQVHNARWVALLNYELDLARSLF